MVSLFHTLFLVFYVMGVVCNERKPCLFLAEGVVNTFSVKNVQGYWYYC